MNLFWTILRALEWLLWSVSAYQLGIALLGFWRKPKSLSMISPQIRFAILVPAHNEARVLFHTLEELRKQEYPRGLWHAFVIADHCDDDTAQVAQGMPHVTVLVRNNQVERGKGHALRWAFSQPDFTSYHPDAFVILDADNLMDPRFLSTMNRRLLAGEDVIQAYLDVKNPRDNWMTKAYAVSYWATNRMFQLAREHMGLSVQLGGTGFVMRRTVFETFGWEATSLTEDLEFTQRYLLATGKRIAWANETCVYDEKPLGMAMSWRQRVRWMAGHADCLLRFFPALILGSIRTKNVRLLDSALYLLQPFLVPFATVSSLIGTFFSQARLPWVLLLGFAILYNALPLLALVLDRRAHAIRWIFYVLFFGLTWIPIITIGFLRRKQRTWSHTLHRAAYSLSEVEGAMKRAE